MRDIQQFIFSPTCSVNEAFNNIDYMRKSSKGGWYCAEFQLCSLQILVKGYKTWLQVFRIDGTDYSNPMEQSVETFRKHVIKSLDAAFSTKYPDGENQ